MFDKLTPRQVLFLTQVRDGKVPPEPTRGQDSARQDCRRRGYVRFDKMTRRWRLTPLGLATLADFEYSKTAIPVPSVKVCIDYTNYRGERGEREIIPGMIRFASSPYHPEPQWLLDAHDVEKAAERTFAMRDIHRWMPITATEEVER